MSEECGNCRFWLKRTDRAGDGGGGYCRRFPPFAPSSYTTEVLYSPYRFYTRPGSDHLNDAWPNVHQQEWCGEYRSAEPPTSSTLTEPGTADVPQEG
jgi:hypothetical protein